MRFNKITQTNFFKRNNKNIQIKKNATKIINKKQTKINQIALKKLNLKIQIQK